jgi:ribosomal protein S18 acetylase RimI-like enzyme
MTAETFDIYFDAAVASYAQDNVDAGRWPIDGAQERSRADFLSLLPAGLNTPNHYLMDIRTTNPETTVGVLWFFVEEKFGVRSAFIYDIEIDTKSRQQGHATRAIQELEKLVASLGVSQIGLHVFSHNKAAQILYRQLGFRTTGSNMVKDLD